MWAAGGELFVVHALVSVERDQVVRLHQQHHTVPAVKHVP